MLRKHGPAAAAEPEPKHERGFALLLVFALAASVAILIYLEIPRVAFERQRDKEALLIDRGEQYARAIELYARKNNKYPKSLDELEHAQTIRFLRQRYKDPMTGKDEWRLVHMANGQYVDSKVHKPAGALGKEESGPSVLASKIQGLGQAATLLPQDGQNVSAALQKRGSDRISPGGTAGASSGDAGQDGALQNGVGSANSNSANSDATRAPNQPQNNAALGGQMPVQPPSGLANSARFPFPGQQADDAQQPGNTQGLANTPAFGSVPPQSQQDSTANQPAAGGLAQPPAMQAIQAILGAQRGAPAGGNSSVAGGNNGVAGGQVGTGGPAGLGSGLVGVATTVEMEGIRRYKDHSNYSEWEFVFDPKDTKGQAQGGATQQPGAAGNASNNASGNPSSNNPGSSFGGMSGGTPAPPTNSVPKN